VGRRGCGGQSHRGLTENGGAREGFERYCRREGSRGREQSAYAS